MADEEKEEVVVLRSLEINVGWMKGRRRVEEEETRRRRRVDASRLETNGNRRGVVATGLGASEKK